MSKVHYFQRYSGRENMVTNNTLLLFLRIYNHSPAKFASLLNELTNLDINLGVDFSQQTRMGNSIPDGMISQSSFRLLIETKVNAYDDINQLKRHAESFDNEDQKILLFLTKHAKEETESENIRKKVLQGLEQQNINFVHITYENICTASHELFNDYEVEMKELTNDYWAYCNEMKLIDQTKNLMRVVPCGDTIKLNKKHGIYFHPSNKGYTKHNYVGIYKSKKVQCLWKIESVFDVTYVDGQLQKKFISGNDTKDYDEKIIAMIHDAKEHCGYNITKNHRFFCGEPYETKFKKESSGGIMGARFINLGKVLGNFESIESVADIAEQLRNEKWT